MGEDVVVGRPAQRGQGEALALRRAPQLDEGTGAKRRDRRGDVALAELLEQLTRRSELVLSVLEVPRDERRDPYELPRACNPEIERKVSKHRLALCREGTGPGRVAEGCLQHGEVERNGRDCRRPDRAGTFEQTLATRCAGRRGSRPERRRPRERGQHGCNKPLLAGSLRQRKCPLEDSLAVGTARCLPPLSREQQQRDNHASVVVEVLEHR